jgi:hypothetical protein
MRPALARAGRGQQHLAVRAAASWQVIHAPPPGSIFDFWEQRLSKHLKTPDSKYAKALLDPIARDPRGATHDILSQALAKWLADQDERLNALRYLLELLTADGYLVKDGKRHRFLSPLLREYWRRHIIHD